MACNCDAQLEILGFATADPQDPEGGVTPLVRCTRCGCTWWRM